MKITPLEDRLVIDEVRLEMEMRGLLYIPDSAKEAPTLGKVLSTGPGRHENGVLVPMGVKPGDYVLYAKYSGTTAEVKGREIKILHESDVLCLVDMEEDEERVVGG